MKPKEAIQFVDTILGNMGPHEQAIFREKMVETYALPIGQAALVPAGVTPLEAVVSPGDDYGIDELVHDQVKRLDVVKGSEKFIDSLTAKEWDYALKAQQAMAEKFGGNPQDFNFVMSQNKDDTRKLALVYDAPIGFEKGSWNDIFWNEKDNDYRLEIDGIWADTRLVMTWQVYQDMIATQRLNGLLELADDGRTATWLTGEESMGRYAPLGSMDNHGKVYNSGVSLHIEEDDGEPRCFRPGVLIRGE